MSAIDTRVGGRRAAQRDAAERRKKLILVGLVVVLAAVLAFELPKLLKRSSSSSGTVSTSIATTATPTATATASPATASTTARRARAIRRMAAKDPFVPLIREREPKPSVAQPAIRFTPTAAAARLRQARAANAAQIRPAAPRAAVIETNGRRQVVGLSQVFTVGDAHFRLVSVTPKAMRIKVVGGLFAGRKQAITVRKGHRVKLANTATGVEYRLLFEGRTIEAPTVTEQTTTPQATTTTQSSTQPTTTSPASGSQTPGS